jgi:hypothetical protein
MFEHSAIQANGIVVFAFKLGFHPIDLSHVGA